jgi:hypothetical protein
MDLTLGIEWLDFGSNQEIDIPRVQPVWHFVGFKRGSRG